MKIKRILCLALAIVITALLFAGCANETEEKKGFNTFEDFENARLGVLTGSVFDKQTEELFPNAKKYNFDTITDLLLNIDQNKIDGFLEDRAFYSAVAWEREGYCAIESDKTIPSDFGFITADNQRGNKIKKELNEFIEKMNKHGGTQKLAEKWFSGTRPTKFENYKSLTGENGTIYVGTTDTDPPFSFQNETILTGFDVEYITLFAREYGYKLEMSTVDFSFILGSVQTGKYDLGIGGITITEERKEVLNFTNPYYKSSVIMVTKGTENRETTLADISTKKLGIVTGSIFSVTLPSRLPNATYLEFNNYSDVISALENGKIDAFPTDESIYKSMLWEGSLVDRIDESIAVSNYGFIYPKGKNLQLQQDINEYLAKTKADGTHKALEEKWFGDQEPTEFVSYDNLTGTKGEIIVAICSTSKPFIYLKNNKFAGFDIEFITAFAQEYGYTIRFEDTEFASIMAGIQAGRYDIGMSGVTMTEERKESVDFSDIYHTEDLVFVIKSAKGTDDDVDFWTSTKESFQKTFIREQRWKLIAEGIYTTMVISLFSVLGGTLLGFALYMAARSKTKWLSKVTKGIAKGYSTIMAGTPTLVVLMLLFYVVFTSPDMSGVLVAIVGFILTFGSFVYDNLALTVSGVDNGQLEAAYALGYSRNRTFFRIILPQAMKMFIPAYSGEIVNLIKATSVVGYIAVNDLTKMGDIIRGNTYEAFFPLIAVAVIYFAITWMIAGLLGILKRKTEPKRRKNKNILKGVKR